MTDTDDRVCPDCECRCLHPSPQESNRCGCDCEMCGCFELSVIESEG